MISLDIIFLLNLTTTLNKLIHVVYELVLVVAKLFT